MNIPTVLQTAPIDLAISNKLRYAGTERIIYALNKEFSKKGCISLVAASGDSDLNGHGLLLPTTHDSLWITNTNGLERAVVRSHEAYDNHYRICLDLALDNKADIIHDHPGQYLVNSAEYDKRKEWLDIPIVTTIHEDIQENVLSKISLWKKLQEEKRDVHFIGISESHRKKYESNTGLDMPYFVYNGLEIEKFPFRAKKQNYMFWIGRLSEIKGTDLAVQVALETKCPLIIAGEVHTPYKQFYEKKVKPHITHTFENETYETQERLRENLIDRLENNENIIDKGQIYFIGPLDDRQKSVFYKHAQVVLVPNRWEEPFGLISIEGMASGTPVVGTSGGALPEVIKHNETGYIANLHFKNETLDEKRLIQEVGDLVKNIHFINPLACRERVKNYFTSEIMANNYLRIYEHILNQSFTGIPIHPR
ncbi:glycosyltransferase [Candidatus Pacearchaeota archaeon]|nr:glycosyltransferase [Candidatus Pacearchaeota archaeon]